MYIWPISFILKTLLANELEVISNFSISTVKLESEVAFIWSSKFSEKVISTGGSGSKLIFWFSLTTSKLNSSVAGKKLGWSFWTVK